MDLKNIQNLKSALSQITVFVTPSMAKEWLDAANKAGIRNRNLNKTNVRKYKADIEDGNWKLTHQGIAFAKDGYLADGFHRLTAIVEADKGIILPVTFDIDRQDVLSAVDHGGGRTLAQQLTIMGETNTFIKAAVCRSLGLLLTPDLNYGSSLTQNQETAILNKYRTSIDYVVSTDTKGTMPAHVKGPVVLFHHLYSPIAEKFFSGLVNGANLAANDPCLILRERIKETRKSSSRDRAALMMKTICAIDYFAKEESMDKLVLSKARYLSYCKRVNIPVNNSLLNNFGKGSGK